MSTGGRDESLLAQDRDTARRRETIQEGEEPVAAAVLTEAVDFWEVERKVVGQDAVQDLGLSSRDRFVHLREFLDIVDAGSKRVMIALRSPYGEHVQDDLGVLRVVLVPAIVERLPGPGERQGRDKPDIEPSLEQAPCDRP